MVRDSKNCFSYCFFFLGSGDMDGMNKVNVVTNQCRGHLELNLEWSEMLYIFKKTLHSLSPEFPKQFKWH